MDAGGGGDAIGEDRTDADVDANGAGDSIVGGDSIFLL